ncbi:hypothetical protein EDD40_0470 [Saccharothrix texasensis]|uniref:Uncharacterized protein n=1 Tax=Saccharothrix texasensis TaxID=103734 RepID=A0A3N1GYD5_9PSEU|nr:hypothetical protein EDD40_0470 [Saccharothrix texasensis]
MGRVSRRGVGGPLVGQVSPTVAAGRLAGATHSGWAR